MTVTLIRSTEMNSSAHVQGQTLYINYGHKSDEELLLGYGFILGYNDANFVSITISAEARQGASGIAGCHTQCVGCP